MPTSIAPTGKRLLIVDDDPVISAGLVRRFENLGYAAEKCHDGARGLDLLASKPYDGVLLDLMMPKKDGLALLADRKTTVNAATPVFVLTTCDNDRAETALKLGAKKVFFKLETNSDKVTRAIAEELSVD